METFTDNIHTEEEACGQLNLNYGTLSGWRKQRVKKNESGKKSKDDVQEELARLKNESKNLRVQMKS
jgi:transposase